LAGAMTLSPGTATATSKSRRRPQWRQWRRAYVPLYVPLSCCPPLCDVSTSGRLLARSPTPTPASIGAAAALLLLLPRRSRLHAVPWARPSPQPQSGYGNGSASRIAPPAEIDPYRIRQPAPTCDPCNTAVPWAPRVCPYDTIRYDTLRDASLTCARKPIPVSLIYRTEPTTKKSTLRTVPRSVRPFLQGSRRDQPTSFFFFFFCCWRLSRRSPVRESSHQSANS